jgi:3',5'-cyclic AMP phosphodiesterase CpdA
MVIFLHISDIHIPDKQGDLWFSVDPCKKLEKLIELTQKLELKPSFTVITGDISHTGTKKSYKLVKKYIKKIQSLGGPIYPTMGTHDNRQNFSNILLDKTTSQEEPPCYYSQTNEGLHIIAMDSHTPGTNTGSFSEEQLDWLEAELKDHQDEPAIIAFHDPIFFFGELEMFKKADATRFKEIVSKGNVLAVLNGHLHCPLFTMVDGVYYVQAGSPLWENTYNERGIISSDSSGFNLLSYNEDPEGNPVHLPKSFLVKPVSFSMETQLIDRTT